MCEYACHNGNDVTENFDNFRWSLYVGKTRGFTGMLKYNTAYRQPVFDNLEMSPQCILREYYNSEDTGPARERHLRLCVAVFVCASH